MVNNGIYQQWNPPSQSFKEIYKECVLITDIKEDHEDIELYNI